MSGYALRKGDIVRQGSKRRVSGGSYPTSAATPSVSFADSSLKEGAQGAEKARAGSARALGCVGKLRCCLQTIPQSAWRLPAPFTQGSQGGYASFKTAGFKPGGGLKSVFIQLAVYKRNIIKFGIAETRICQVNVLKLHVREFRYFHQEAQTIKPGSV